MTPKQLQCLFAQEDALKAKLAKTQAAISEGITAYSHARGYRVRLRNEAVRLEVMQ